ncbi:hypothetical protein DPMN_178171 [Dreissena polymorpha]|uniref:Uncharacterized protein n=1 Tax=Dreissena polymorpha TaxID=45954 RepID=A0A9D4EBN5_DREPO|nr:hypothetical protein DPMN_178171 [Dreissena polymorpha]
MFNRALNGLVTPFHLACHKCNSAGKDGGEGRSSLNHSRLLALTGEEHICSGISFNPMFQF